MQLAGAGHRQWHFHCCCMLCLPCQDRESSASIGNMKHRWPRLQRPQARQSNPRLCKAAGEAAAAAVSELERGCTTLPCHLSFSACWTQRSSSMHGGGCHTPGCGACTCTSTLTPCRIGDTGRRKAARCIGVCMRYSYLRLRHAPPLVPCTAPPMNLATVYRVL